MAAIDEVLIEGLPFGSLFDGLSSLGMIYDDAAKVMDAFAAESGLACPSGCGRCCESFIPDVLPIEAAWTAAWLIRHEPARAKHLAISGFSTDAQFPGRCPFFVAEGNFHCGIYGGRPLICRLFGFSSVLSKDGESTFTLCRHMPELPDKPGRSWKGSKLQSAFGGKVPLMSDFATRIVAIRPSESHERRMLTQALPEALRRIYFLQGFGNSDAEADPDEPEPEKPLSEAG
ncbi:MAG TPA: YkgJ family cysteine cluster protein [Rectinemataceae bacterium]|nr:YkgJ family cysteine cluster protein [Rectinemataceae bacterium]